MAYSITTKDGITINNIPDDVAPDSPDLKARVAAIRAGGGAAALEAPAPAAPAQSPGFFEGLAESVTGRARATPETQTLPEWTSMPELNQMSVASFKTAMGTLMSNPKETVQILQANFPGVQVRQDAKGNYLMRSSVDQQEYAIPPGFTMGDIPRAVGAVAAFTPAGRAATIPGAILAGGATQTAIEATQAATGGEFSPAEVAMAAATAPAGQILQRVAPPVVQAVKSVGQRITGRAPVPTPPAPGAVPPVAPAAVPPVAPAAPMAPPAAPAAAAAVAPEVAPVATEAFEEIGTLARKASGSGPGSATAKAKLADLAQVNTEARAAADRLGMDLPFDVFSDNQQVRAAVGLTRSLAGGEAEAAWVNTVRTAIGKADEVVQQFDAAFIEGRPAPGATSQRILDSLKGTQAQLAKDASTIYDRVDEVVPKQSIVQFPKLTETINRVITEVGETGLSAQERKLYALATEPNVTYGRLLREKNLIGQAMAGKESPYSNMAAGDLKRLYGALSEDQLGNVATIGGEALRQELRAANLLTAKKKALESRIVGAFGKEIDGSVSNLMQSAIKSAAKGDAAQFNKLMKVVPSELRKETVATALASVASSARAGQEGAFGFAEFAKTYRGLRANPPVYKQVIDVLGKDADPVLRDLFEISRRITDARAQVLTTGKANQALVESMKAEGLLGTIMQSTMAQRAVTGAAGLVPGGGFVAPDIVQFMSKGNTDAVKAAGKLFASDEFQKLAIDAATKPEVGEAVLRRAAMSKAFGNFATAAKLPQSLDARVQFLQSALQAERQFDQENQ